MIHILGGSGWCRRRTLTCLGQTASVRGKHMMILVLLLLTIIMFIIDIMCMYVCIYIYIYIHVYMTYMYTIISIV